MSWNTHIPKFRRFVLQNFPFIEEDFDALTDYALICKVVEYLNNVINSQNQLISEVETFETNITNDFNNLSYLFEQLKSFVDNYFENLDVQEEINNKLEDMAESGQLADIIAQYLTLAGVLAYDTVDALKNATNIANGSFAETYGFYTKGDGGGALYKIRNVTNDDVIDNMFIISITADPSNTLVAELINSGRMNVSKFGIKKDGSRDETANIQKLINANIPVLLDEGTYLVEGTLTGDITLIGASQKSIIYGGETSHNVIDLSDGTATNKIYLSNVAFKNAKVNLYQYDNGSLSYATTSNQLNIYAENIWFKDLNDSSQGQFWGQFIKTPKPANYNRFESNAYGCYPIEIVNNSGYNALMINNVCTNAEGTTQSVPDNSAIGIIDKVNSSAPTLFIDQKSNRHSIGIANADAPSKSAKYTNRIFDINHYGHIGIGVSCDNDDSTFSGSYTIKIKAQYPGIGMLRNTYPIAMTVDADDNLKITRGGWESATFAKHGMQLQKVTSAYYLPDLTADVNYTSGAWLGVMRYVEDSHKIAFWDGVNSWRDAMGTVLKTFAQQ